MEHLPEEHRIILAPCTVQNLTELTTMSDQISEQVKSVQPRRSNTKVAAVAVTLKCVKNRSEIGRDCSRPRGNKINILETVKRKKKSVQVTVAKSATPQQLSEKRKR